MDLETMLQFIPTEELIAETVLYALSETMDWGLMTCNIPNVWKFTKGEGITVAVLDTGIQDHIDLKENILAKYDFTGEGVEDTESGHGLNVSGIIAALQNDIGIVGIAPQSKIISIRVLNGSGVGSFGSILKGLQQCLTLDVDIINMSLGIPQEPPPEIHDVIKQLAAQGKILIAAAGNDGGAVNYPGAYDEVIAVAPIDKNKNLAPFASKGSKVAAVAPGVDIFSLYLNDGYKSMSGSSQAAPFFSGVVALILAYAKKNPTSAQYKSYMDILKLLDVLCDPNVNDSHGGKLIGCGFGVPIFGNNMPWKTNTNA